MQKEVSLQRNKLLITAPKQNVIANIKTNQHVDY